MKPKRHTLPLTLTGLILAGGAAAQTAPGYPELFDQAGVPRPPALYRIAAPRCRQKDQGGL